MILANLIFWLFQDCDPSRILTLQDCKPFGNLAPWDLDLLRNFGFSEVWPLRNFTSLGFWTIWNFVFSRLCPIRNFVIGNCDEKILFWIRNRSITYYINPIEVKAVFATGRFWYQRYNNHRISPIAVAVTTKE